MRRIILLGLVVLAPVLLRASQTEFWQVGTFDEFLRGDLKGVSLNQEGEIELAPPAEAVFNPDETVALSLASDQAGRLYLGTGHQGKVFRVDPDGKGRILFQAPEPEILALAAGPDGNVYAASSPEGKIYRITPEGHSSVFYDPKTKYIWSLLFDAQGRLYAGTGDRGLIDEIDPSGKGRVFFESRQTHIICLALDREGNLLAGSDPDGLVFRINPQGKGFVLYKADFPEIHALALDSAGRIYAAALGTAGINPVLPFLTPQTPEASPTTVTTVTVMASAQEAPEQPAAEAQQPGQPAPHELQPQQRRSPSFNRPAPTPFPAATAPQGRGALVRISPDYSAETLWSSDKESIFGLALEGRNILFSTDGRGRIFRLSPSPDGPRVTLLAETRESLATRLLVAGGGLYVATSNVAKLFRLGLGPGTEGSYESSVKDTKFISHWGDLSWRAEVPPGSSLEFYSRSGNSEKPDSTWSEWAGPYTASDGSRVASPSARYVQWKAVFKKGPGAASPMLDDVTLAYLNQNLPPEIREINVSTAGERTGPGGRSSSDPGPAAGLGLSAGSAGFTASAGKAPTTISWQAEDPNGDRLVYSLYLKAPDEKEWHLVKDKIRDSTYTLEPTTVPDGQYIARLVASDEESNPPGLERRSELESAPFWIDNTPPRIEVAEQHVERSSAKVRFRAASNLSPLRSAEVSTDGGEWRPAASDDGIVDSRSQTFTVTLSGLKPGEHLILLRVYDTAGNGGIGKAVIRAGGGLPGNQ
jgi:sugar lactone lactonase YvrE